MRHPHLGFAAVAATVGLLAACVGTIPLHERQQAERDRFNAYAGDPIEEFTWLGRFDSWQPLGRYELAVFTGPSDAYLIKVSPPCDDLQFVNRIGLTSTGSTVHTRFDAVRTGNWRCPIEEIRRVDYRRLKADLRLEAQARKEAPERKADAAQ